MPILAPRGGRAAALEGNHGKKEACCCRKKAHEIAHSVLHTNITAAFHEFTLFDDTDRQEYEANLFAAELLLSDDCVLNALNEDQFFFQAAKALYVPAELLDFKFRVMKRKGYKLESPIVSHGNFLKTIE